MASGQQHIQQDPQGIDIGRNRRDCARELLRSGIFGCQSDFNCLKRLSIRVVILEQFGDSEIEDFHLSVVAYQDVRRLEIPVYDQVGVRVGNGLDHLEKQPDARFDTEPVLVAVAVDVVALYVLEDQVRLSGPRHSRIDQSGDIRMCQTAENDAFAMKSLLGASSDQRDLEKLHRYFSLESRVVSFREPNAAHPTLANLGDQPVRAQSLASQARFRR